MKSSYIEEDGLCYSLHVDVGWWSEIKYAYTVGSLTDDTIALIQSLEKPEPPYRPSSNVFSDDVRNAWKSDLDNTWAEDRYNEWLADGLLSDGETKAQFIADQMDNYHLWPHEWQVAYKAHMEKLNAPVGTKKELVYDGTLSVFSDDDGNYFFSTKYYNYGALTKADKQDAMRYLSEY